MSSALINDFKYGFRMLIKKPGFTAIALIVLAIGIGANMIMFSIVNVLALRPPKVMEPDRLVECHVHNSSGRQLTSYLSHSDYVAIRDGNPVFSEFVAYGDDLTFVTLGHGDHDRLVCAMHVSANYFSALGVKPLYGRAFLPEEERYGTEPVAVLSHRAWRRYGAEPDFVGRHVLVNNTLIRIIGVAPDQFTGTSVFGPDLWLSLGCYGSLHRKGETKPEGVSSEWWNYPSLALMGRIKSNLSLAAAQAQWQSLLPRVQETLPPEHRQGCNLNLQPLSRLVPGGADDEQMILSVTSLFVMGISFVVLLIACLNLSSMITIQGKTRHREIAVRLAMGGGHLRIIRQLLIESLLLACCGGLLGLILAFWGTHILNVWASAIRLPFDLASPFKASLDGRILAATLFFCVLATVLFGLRPALRLSRRDIVSDLKESVRGSVAHRHRRRWRLPRGLSVVGQITMSVVLVMGAALFTHSARQALKPNPGYRMDDKLILELDPGSFSYDRTRKREIYNTLVEHVRTLPGIQAVGTSRSFTFGISSSFDGSVREYTPGTTHSDVDLSLTQETFGCIVGTDYFQAMGVPLLRGRSFSTLDQTPDAEKVVIIDNSLACKLRPGGNALGCLIQIGENSTLAYRVVGIVPTLRRVSGDKEHSCHVYKPLRYDHIPQHIHIRVGQMGHEAKATLLRKIRQKIHTMDSKLSILWLTTLEDYHLHNPLVFMIAMGARLALIFGAMALFLASLGIYAIKGHMVALRTPEIGIRKALGATHISVIGMVLREGISLTLIGLFLGLLFGFSAAHVLRSLFYGINPIDPISIIVTVFLIGLASLLAGFFPARRAAKIDSMEALRYE